MAARSLTFVGLVVSSLLIVGQPTSTAADGCDVLPSEASLVVRLRAPDTTVSDLAAFLNKVQPGVGGIIQAQAGMLGMVIENPTLAGVDKAADWYLALFAKPTGAPDVVLLIPATDAAAMKAGITNASFKFGGDDKWGVYSRSEARVQLVESCLAGDVAPIATLFDRRDTELFNSGHLTVFINGRTLKTVFADKLGGAEDQLDQLIDVIASQVPAGKQSTDLTYVWDMYRELGRGVIRAVRDSESLVVSIKATEDSLQIDELLSVSKGSNTDMTLSSQPSSDLAALKLLPEGQAMYAGVHLDAVPLVNFAKRMMSKMPVADAVREKVLQSFEKMQDAKFGSFVGGGDMDINAVDGVMSYFGVSEISPGAVIREAFASMEGGFEYEVGGLKQKQSYQRDVEQIDGLPVDLFTIKQTIPPELDPLGVQRAVNEKLYGSDGITQRMVVRGNTLYQTMGGGTDAMKQLLHAKSWTDSQLLDARNHLPEKANFVCLIDIPSMTQRFAQLILSTGTLPVPLTADQLDGLRISRSYAGFSVTAEPQHLLVRSSLPVETFQGFVQIGMFIQQLQAGGN